MGSPISLSTIMSLAQQAASKSEQAANAAERDSESGANEAFSAAKQQEAEDKANIASKGQGKQGQSEYNKESSKSLTLPQTMNGLMKGGEVVDPMAQLSLMQMLSKDEQDYAAVTYGILASARDMS